MVWFKITSGTSGQISSASGVKYFNKISTDLHFIKFVYMERDELLVFSN